MRHIYDNSEASVSRDHDLKTRRRTQPLRLQPSAHSGDHLLEIFIPTEDPHEAQTSFTVFGNILLLGFSSYSSTSSSQG